VSLEPKVALERKVALTGRLIEGAGSLVALALPTVALVRLQGLPDDLSRIAYVILPTVSVALIVAIIARGTNIARLTGKKAARLTLLLAVAGAICTIGYSYVSDKLVVSLVYPEEGPPEVLVKPIVPSQEIQAIIGRYQGDYIIALTQDPNAEALKRSMFRERAGSVALLLGTMLLAQLLFVAAIVGGAWWLAERHLAPAPGSKNAPAPGSKDV
jgi:hypothetical protein